MLAEHEEAVGRLYAKYAENFNEHKAFWATLAFEESDHAKKIRKLIEERKLNHAVFNPDKYDSQTIEKSFIYIKEQTDRMRNENISLENALSVALNIEKAIIDGKVFEAFKGQTRETREIIRELATSVTDHYQTIEQVWLEQKHQS